VRDFDAVCFVEGSDKSRLIKHTYAPVYEALLGGLKAPRILEIGSGCQAIMGGGYRAGASARAFRSFFGATVVTMDCSDEAARIDQGEGIIACVADAYSTAGYEAAVAHGPYDMAIDDGSHLLEHQIDFVERYRPLVAPGGVIVVEDLTRGAAVELQRRFGGREYRGRASGDDALWWLRLPAAHPLLPGCSQP